jgi:hypothetical protein
VIVRLALSIFLVILSLLGCYTAYGAGVAGMVARYAPQTELLEAAVRLAPGDPKLHYLLGHAYLHDLDNLDIQKAIQSLNRAVELSPNDYLIWLTQAKALERAGDLAGAEESLMRSISLAPHYFEPHWQLANFLVRIGKVDRALPEFRQALAANPEQLTYGLELVWQLSDGDLGLTESIVPLRATARLDYIQFLFSKGRYREGIAQWTGLPVEMRDGASWRGRQFIEQLFIAREYDLAWEIWHELPEIRGQMPVKGKFYNGSFDLPTEKFLAGFEWQFENSDQAKLSIDSLAPASVGRSLRIEYSAEGSPSFEHIRQFLAVEPGREYRLRYSARSEGLTGGSLPFVEITDARGGSLLNSRSEPMLLGSVEWHQYDLVFRTGPETRAVRLSIRRNADCRVEGPCPIFGRVWFTGFLLEVVDKK